MAKENDAVREEGAIFLPKWDAAGLVSAIVQDAGDGTVLMLGHMDAEALEHTRTTGLVHFHSRSRGKLWQKGEESGNVLKVRELRVDCDQDAVLVMAEPAGPTCHTGRRSCFYRTLEDDGLKPLRG